MGKYAIEAISGNDVAAAPDQTSGGEGRKGDIKATLPLWYEEREEREKEGQREKGELAWGRMTTEERERQEGCQG